MADHVPDPKLIPAVPSAYAQALARAFAGIGITLNIISFFMFAGRIYSRLRPAFRLGWDDGVCIVAYVLIVADSALLLDSSNWIFTGKIAEVTLADLEDGFRSAVYSEPIWSWTMASIKISVALMILRLQREAHWRRFLYFMIAIQVVVAIYNTIFQLLQCVPLHKAWDFLGIVKGTCLSSTALRISISTVSSFNILTDVIFSLIPITFLRKMQRPMREKIIIGILMGLGILASAASIVKAVYADKVGTTSDATAEGISICMWTLIEEQFGFIAACIPCLKSPFQRFLSYFGITSSHNKTSYGHNRPSGGYGQMYGDGKVSSHLRSDALGNTVRMKSMNRGATDAQSEENILPFDTEVGKGEIWCTTEVRMEEERGRLDSRRGRHESAGWDEGSEISQEAYDSVRAKSDAQQV